jgi:hypothetical protein
MGNITIMNAIVTAMGGTVGITVQSVWISGPSSLFVTNQAPMFGVNPSGIEFINLIILYRTVTKKWN